MAEADNENGLDEVCFLASRTTFLAPHTPCLHTLRSLPHLFLASVALRAVDSNVCARQFDYDGVDTHDASAEELAPETAAEPAITAGAATDGTADTDAVPAPTGETAGEGAAADEPAAADVPAASQDQAAENGCGLPLSPSSSPNSVDMLLYIALAKCQHAQHSTAHWQTRRLRWRLQVCGLHRPQ